MLFKDVQMLKLSDKLTLHLFLKYSLTLNLNFLYSYKVMLNHQELHSKIRLDYNFVMIQTESVNLEM